MKYITSCPQCDTHFLINDELITAYGGKVQCGSCEHVFNASDRLTKVDDDITSADEYQASKNNASQESTTTPLTTAITEPAITETIEPSSPELNDASDVDYIIGKPTTTAEPSAEKKEAPEVTLNLDNIKKRTKKTRQYSSLSILIGLLLLLALLLQAAYFLREKIASEYPQLKPTLERVCKKLKCSIDLPKNLELISIGDSDMQEDDSFKSVINFSSTLKNDAAYAQAYPNIELTLTDSDDVPVIKKLVKPEEYLASKKKMHAGLAPHEVANIKIALRVDEESVASYRLLLLY